MMTQTKKNLRAALYIRVASYEQLGEPVTALYCRTATPSDEGITAQKDLLMRHADMNGYKYCVTFVDNGESGADINRPAFQDMQKGIESGYIKRVVISDFSRLCRNMVLTNELLTLFQKYGVELISVKDGFNSFDKTESKPLFNLSSAFLKPRAGYNE